MNKRLLKTNNKQHKNTYPTRIYVLQLTPINKQKQLQLNTETLLKNLMIQIYHELNSMHLLLIVVKKKPLSKLNIYQEQIQMKIIPIKSKKTKINF